MDRPHDVHGAREFAANTNPLIKFHGCIVVLGIGGVKMLRALGHHGLQRVHMNEGHASLPPLALLDEQAVRAGHSSFTREGIEEVRRQCVFTTHTPVPAGHDQFPADLVNRGLGRTDVAATTDVLRWENYLNMTYLAPALLLALAP
jgi:glycogen phosphorylase